MINSIIGIFITNCIAHLISFQRLKKTNSSDAPGVLVFSVINAIIAVLLWQDFSWGKWIALVVPFIGGSALLFTKIIRGQGNWIDYVILILDILAIGLCLI